MIGIPQKPTVDYKNEDSFPNHQAITFLTIAIAGNPLHYPSVILQQPIMKYVVLCIFLGAVAARPQDAPPASSPPVGAASASDTSSAASPAVPHSGNSSVTFVKNDVKPLDGQGNYQYDIELSDGTKLVQMGHTQAPEAGSTDSVLVIQGSYSYLSPEGKTISITYTADDKGFVAMGDAIPQAPAAAASAPGAAAPPPAAAGSPPASPPAADTSSSVPAAAPAPAASAPPAVTPPAA